MTSSLDFRRELNRPNSFPIVGSLIILNIDGTSPTDAPKNVKSLHVRRTSPGGYELVATSTDTTHLEVVGELEDRDPRHLEQQVLDLLTGGVVLTWAKLRDTLSVKNERLGDVLQSLERTAQLRRTATGWQRVE